MDGYSIVTTARQSGPQMGVSQSKMSSNPFPQATAIVSQYCLLIKFQQHFQYKITPITQFPYQHALSGQNQVATRMRAILSNCNRMSQTIDLTAMQIRCYYQTTRLSAKPIESNMSQYKMKMRIPSLSLIKELMD
ncbi:hypothetical protein FGO68_gene3605 [Halteria grandinella]|uniref:Uncharacterized protein n=1 Tax=Halteria grandinella TaxID=5974 RepID=A0A8J8SUF4_HALGN|nr:hypothetical protein FGO68_gene3605 [Halteria grandinella]